jgi:capsular exopolysaccharide synthesis family protein
MSHIFDALLRSEKERYGVSASALSTATQLLQLGERHAGQEWGTAVETEPLDSEVGSKSNLSTFPPVVATELEDPTADELTCDDECKYPFSQFQPLQISVPAQSRLISLTANESLAAEKFRYLGVRLQHIRRSRQLKVILITSAVPREGKSTVAANLACTLARKPHQRVLLLDGDLRRPTIAKSFGSKNIPGICEWLENKRDLLSSIYHLVDQDLWILPAGDPTSNAMELLQSGKLSGLMDQISTWFDWIIIDSPPVLPLGDTAVWTRMVDGVLLVTRKGVSEKLQLQKSLEAIESQKLIGAVLNCSQRPHDSKYYYHYQPAAAS